MKNLFMWWIDVAEWAGKRAGFIGELTVILSGAVVFSLFLALLVFILGDVGFGILITLSFFSSLAYGYYKIWKGKDDGRENL